MKIFLGDGAYAEVDEDGEVVLTTENGITIQNIIYLNREVLKNFLAFLVEIGYLKL